MPRKKNNTGEVDRTARDAGVRFRQAREDKGVTQSDLGKASGVAQSNVAHFEKGTKALGLGAFLRIIRAAHDRGMNVSFVVLGPAPEQAPASDIEAAAKLRTAETKARREKLRDEKANETSRRVSKSKRSAAR